MSNIALIGTGKTGQFVPALLEKAGHIPMIFNSKNSPTLKDLKAVEAIICFTPGDVFLSFLPLLLDSKKPVICGSTGFIWPAEIAELLVKSQTPWVYSTNFSLLMNYFFIMSKKLKRLPSSYHKKIHEIHHTHKKDSPSGTAITLSEIIGVSQQNITSERKGDEIGFHECIIEGPAETLTLSHRGMDRSIFAEGAIKALEMILEKPIPYGLHSFTSLLEKESNHD